MKKKKFRLRKIICFILLSVLLVLSFLKSDIYMTAKKQVVNTNEFTQALTVKSQIERNILQEQSTSGENCQYERLDDGSIILNQYYGNDSYVVVSDKLDEYTVDKINRDAFIDCSEVEAIKIPNAIANNVDGLTGFQLAEDLSDENNTVYVTTREYNEEYIRYLNLSDEDKAKVTALPSKFLVTEKEFNRNAPEDAIPTATLASSYDLRNTIKQKTGLSIPVDNQGSYGICFAYAATKSAETNLMLNEGKYANFSEIKIGLYTARYSASKTASNFTESYRYCLDDQGVTAEVANTLLVKDYVTQVKDTNATAKNIYNLMTGVEPNMSDAKIEAAIDTVNAIPSTPKYYVLGKVDYTSMTGDYKRSNSAATVKANRDKIKNGIMKYGSVNAFIGNPNDANICRNVAGKEVMCAQSSMGSNYVGHIVSLIGWDDNFSAENFSPAFGVTTNGAYLALNSWGDTYGNGDGTFWISYEDYYVEADAHAITRVSTGKANIAQASVTLSNYEYDYDGTAKKPSVTVKFAGMTLVKDTDYTVAYQNNVNVGAATVVITGKGKYQGTTTAVFGIGKKYLPFATTSLSQTTYTYDGTAKTPTVTAVISGTTLALNTDYTVSYQNNINAGKATVTLNGINNYVGSIVMTFTINPKSIASSNVTLSKNKFLYTAEPKEPTATVNCDTKDLVAGRDYTISYRDNIEEGTEAKAIITGIGNYTGTITVTFEIFRYDISEAVLELDQDDFVYDGNYKKPNVTVKFRGNILEKDVNYTVSYADNLYEGTAKIIVTGIVSYKNTAQKEFTIHRIELSDVDAKVEYPTYLYDGDPKYPRLVLTYEDYRLQEGKDYRATYSDNIEVGTAKVEVTGQGTYKGTIHLEFEIVNLDISEGTLELMKTRYKYDGTPKQPLVRVTYDDVVLTKDRDYMVSYSDNIEAGRAKVTVNGIGQYGGSLTERFVIYKADLKDSEMVVNPSSISYSGTPKTPNVSITYEDNGTILNLIKDKDFTLTYENNVDVGRATVKATGIGEYDGEKTAYFDIVRVNFDNATIAINEEEIRYDGTEKKPRVTVSYEGTVLEEDVDYRIEYSNNLNAGDGTIKIIGIGEYAGGLIEKNFKIEKGNITASVGANNYTFDKNRHSLSISNVPEGARIRYGLSENTYNLDDCPSYDQVGTYKVYYKIQANNYNDFTGEAEIKILPKDINSLNVNVANQEFVYDKNPKSLDLSINHDSTSLEINKDYTVSYSNNINAGRATARINGIGNYTGSSTIDFNIKKGVPLFIVPRGLVTTQGKTLADVKLPTGFAWEDALTTSVGEVGENKFLCSYTDSDTSNYESIRGIEVLIKVNLNLAVSIQGYTALQLDENPTVFITGILPESTTSNIRNNIETNGEIEILEANGSKVSEGSELKTGMKVRVFSGSEEEFYTLSVIGDMNGDGKTSSVDLLKLARYLENLDNDVKNEYLLAGNVFIDTDVNYLDLLKLARVLANLENL